MMMVIAMLFTRERGMGRERGKKGGYVVYLGLCQPSNRAVLLSVHCLISKLFISFVK